MRSHRKKTLLVAILLMILFLFLLSRCTSNQSESISADTPTASPSPTLLEPTQSSDPEEASPMATDTPSPSASPTASPTVKPSATKTMAVSPTPRKSVKPTSSPSEEVIEPDTVVKNDNDGDGWPDFINPTVTFTNANCEDLGDKYLYTYEVNFLGGDNYEIFPKVRGGFRMRLEDGKFWFSPSEEELSNPRYRGPIIYKIRSVIDRSWTLFERNNFDKKTHQFWVERGGKGVQSPPLTVSRLYVGGRESFQLPDILYGLCRK